MLSLVTDDHVHGIMENKRSGILLESGTNEVEFFRFSLGSQLFGVNVAKVRQVVVFDPEKVCRLPEQPAYNLGTVNHRGECILVIDLDHYFEIVVPEQKDPRLLLILEFNKCTLGFVIDSVDRIIRCTWKNFVPVEPMGTVIRSSAIVGTVVDGTDVTPILDVEAMLGEVMPHASIEANIDTVSEAPATSNTEMRIVCCEDSPVVRSVLTAALRKAGYSNVVMLPNGLAAMNYLVGEPRPEVDVIISDIEMPVMDGLALCRTLRGNERFSKTPFYFFSSTVNEQMHTKCLSVGASGAFSKPELDTLIRQLDARPQ